MQVGAPLYLITSTEKCYRCGQLRVVIALATCALHDGEVNTLTDGAEGNEPFMLSYIEEMPESVLAHMQRVCPGYRKHSSRTAGVAYYTNTCECGANFGDHYLFSDPGGAFFPVEEEVASCALITELPIQGVLAFRGQFSQGGAELIFRHAQRVGVNG